MNQNPKSLQALKDWFLKFVESFLVIIGVFQLILTFLPLLFLSEMAVQTRRFFSVAEEKQVIAALAIALIISGYWYWKENKTFGNSARIYSLLHAIIRYWLALSISLYGFSKILNLQFGQYYHTGDVVVNQLTGFQLTWNYFSQSYALGAIIGLCQVAGSILLLFRKTTLLGVFILLPVMINIVLINYFYGIPKGALYNSVFYTVGLLFLLLVRWTDVKMVLFSTVKYLPPIKFGILKPALRLLVIAGAFGTTYIYAVKSKTSGLDGKWKVEEFVRNGDTITDNSWLTDGTIWKNIYIERMGKLILCPNPYVYEYDRSQEATFIFDSLKNQMQVIIQTGWTVTDTMKVNVNRRTHSEMQWTALLKNDTLNLKLSKVSTRR